MAKAPMVALRLNQKKNNICTKEAVQMVATIMIGSCVSVQGTFIRQLSDGKIVVQVGALLFRGRRVGKAA